MVRGHPLASFRSREWIKIENDPAGKGLRKIPVLPAAPFRGSSPGPQRSFFSTAGAAHVKPFEVLSLADFALVKCFLKSKPAIAEELCFDHDALNPSKDLQKKGSPPLEKERRDGYQKESKGLFVRLRIRSRPVQ